MCLRVSCIAGRPDQLRLLVSFYAFTKNECYRFNYFYTVQRLQYIYKLQT